MDIYIVFRMILQSTPSLENIKTSWFDQHLICQGVQDAPASDSRGKKKGL